MVHSVTGYCAGGVFGFTNCSNVAIDNTLMHGCGTVGIDMHQSSYINVKNSSITYDAKGRILTAKDKNGNVTSYVYDGNGNVVETVDALNGTSSFKYNAAGDVVKMTLNRVDAKNNINEQQVTIYEYNGNGLLKKTINAAGKTALYVYDASNNLIQKTDEQGLVTKYSYSSLDLVTNINYNNGKSVDYTYNKVGELIKTSDWTGVNTFEVDLLKRITKTLDAKGKQVEYTYDPVGNQSSIKYPDNTVTTYTYDLIGQMKTVTEPGSKVTEYTYDLAGRMTERLYPNDWEEFFAYDDAGRLLEVKDTDPSNKNMKSINLSYTYDANGNKLSEYKRGNAAGAAKEDVHYLYDGLDRVISAHENYGNTTRLYEYDSLGNVIWERFANGSPDYYDYKYNNLNQMTEKVIGGKDKNTYEYDQRGNLIQENYVKSNNKSSVVSTYIYDETNKMVQGTNEAGEISLYTYNGLGGLVGNEMIVSKNAYGYHGFDSIEPSVPTTLKKHEVIKKDFVLDYTTELKNPLYETEYLGLNYRYGYGTDRISAFITPIPTGGGNLVENEAIKVYYHRDYLGITDFMTSDYTGKVVSWTMYNEWGELTHNAVLNCGVRELDLVKNYTGYEYDSVIGLYFAKNRMYDPSMHRFTQVDPIEDGLNWYAYVECNPVNYVDPLGLWSNVESRLHERSGRSISDGVKAIKADAALSAWLNVTLGVKKDSEYEKQGKTIYYLPQSYWQSLDCVGYEEWYDWVFDTATDMKSITFDFTYNSVTFRIWVWKGDYLNMGAGAELGIYYGGSNHWKPGKDYTMTMTIKLEDKKGEIFYRAPSERTWWITGFDPNRKGVSADLTATYTLDFSRNEQLKGMYGALTKSDDYLKYINKWTVLGTYKLQ